MPMRTARRTPASSTRRLSAAVAVAALLVSAASVEAEAQPRAAGVETRDAGDRMVSYHGLRLMVPGSWKVVDLTSQPHSCLRLDRAALYLGHAGDQRDCPAHLIGGSPALHLEPIDATSLAAVGTPGQTIAAGGALSAVRLPARGPASIALEPAGVLGSAEYGDSVAASLLQRIIRGAVILPGAKPVRVADFPAGAPAAGAGVSAPGTYAGKGFDACTAPSQAVMDEWRRSSDYASTGVYVGGVSRGCAQPNLTATWVSRQVSNGWHLLPTYVGLQAPCTSFSHRMSYDVPTARAQGRAEAVDAIAQAQALGMAAPSTVFADIEGYDNTLPRCVASVLGYVSGWTYTLERSGYMSAVYSSASSGMRDLAAHYDDPTYTRPDDIWLAWWNGIADVDGGSYVPDDQWRHRQRVHQYAGNVTESHGGYTLQIDRDYLEVSTSVHPPKGCPTDLDFATYPMLTVGAHGDAVAAAQCLVARAGFDPGEATGKFEWRTASAIRAFKASVGLDSDDSAVRRWAWTALASAGSTDFLKLGSHGAKVRKVQRALTARLQRTIHISGSFNGRTQRAVKDYQRVLHLTQTGTVGGVTWNALQDGR